MKIQTVTAGVTRLVALPNYENVRYECTASASLEPGDDPLKVYAELSEYCRVNVAEDMERIKPRRKS